MESRRVDLSCTFRSRPRTCGFQKALSARETDEQSEPRKEEGKGEPLKEIKSQKYEVTQRH